MKQLAVGLAVTLFLTLCAVHAQAALPEKTAEILPFKGDYMLYSYAIGDPGPPRKGDTKVMFSVDGKVAKEMFNAIGPDLKDTCGTENGDRRRERDDGKLVCLFGKSDKSYRCNFGFDLKTGKSVVSISC